jgi:flagellar hook-basal body protein
MDVEGNNIANVNTTGYKYARANFSDILSQTMEAAVAPEGLLGGKNAKQVGLGAGISGVSNVFSQGSIQTTDRATDLALEGSGFFIISADGGDTKSYTRNGVFGFDADGNLVNSAGYIVQGWNRDETTGLIDSTTLPESVQVSPGYTSPAKATDSINIKANLNAGNSVENKAVTYALDSTAGLSVVPGAEEYEDDISVLFDSNGEGYDVRDGQGFYMDAAGDATNAATRTQFVYTADEAAIPVSGAAVIGGTTYYRTTEDLRFLMQSYLTATSVDAQVSVNSNGQFSIDNKSTNTGGAGAALSIDIIGGANDNADFTDAIGSLEGQIPNGATTPAEVSREMYVPIHTTSIDIFDSLGIKHGVTVNFRKDNVDTVNGGTSWTYEVTVPTPGQVLLPGGLLATAGNSVRAQGGVSFDVDGAILTSNPTFAFYPNNGAEQNQNFTLAWGNINDFDGLTSYSSAQSSTAAISQDGYAGGDLRDLAVDARGNVLGTFTNGKTLKMAQIAVAKFVNEEGLEKKGSNIWDQSQNSGEPAIGIAGSGGRANIISSALESSNVDLSRSLTQLIVVQRGFQANSKTITTSDTMLDTLLQLKR